MKTTGFGGCKMNQKKQADFESVSDMFCGMLEEKSQLEEKCELLEMENALLAAENARLNQILKHQALLN